MTLLNRGPGKYIQDDHASNDKRQSEDSGQVEGLSQHKPGHEGYKHDPAPDQIAATPTGMVCKASDRKKKAAPYPAITTNDGPSCVKPLLDFNAQVAITSLTMAIDRKNH